jgi:hypothetical protein
MALLAEDPALAVAASTGAALESSDMLDVELQACATHMTSAAQTKKCWCFIASLQR